jgi:hypothetical protein
VNGHHEIEMMIFQNGARMPFLKMTSPRHDSFDPKTKVCPTIGIVY